MEFRFESKVTIGDIWKLSMRHIYGSMVGVCNVVFSIAIVLLTYRFWNEISDFLKGLLVMMCIIFPIVQPIMIYFRAKKQIDSLPKDLVLTINETGIHVSGDNQKTHIVWNRVRGVIREKGMILLAIDSGRGYMLTDRVLGTQKDAFLEYVDSKVKNK